MKALNRQTAMYSRMRRRNQFLEFFVRKLDTKCYFCDVEIDPKVFFGWRDNLTIHHINHDRDDNRIENLVICHRGCHAQYHRAIEKRLDKLAKVK